MEKGKGVRGICGKHYVGRAEECDIVLDHPTVSRVHCRLGIVREDDEELFCTIVDGQSNVGTFLQRGDGAPSAIYLTPRKLCHENVIVIGKFRLVFLITGLPRSKIATEAPARPLTEPEISSGEESEDIMLGEEGSASAVVTATPAVPIEGDPLEQTMEKVAAQDDQDLKQVREAEEEEEEEDVVEATQMQDDIDTDVDTIIEEVEDGMVMRATRRMKMRP